MGYLQQEMINEQDMRSMIDERDKQIRHLYGEIEDQARDMSIVYAMCEHFITRCNEIGNINQIKDAVRWAYEDTGVAPHHIKTFLEKSGLTDPTYCETEYNVHLTVPVMFTIRVDAFDEDDAYDKAMSELDCNGIDNYCLDYNTYDIEYDVEEC